MPPEVTPARLRSRRLWRRIRSVAALLPPMGFQWLRHLFWHGEVLPISRPRTHTHHIYLKMARDRDPLPPVVVVNSAFARLHWPDEDAGRRERLRRFRAWRRLRGHQIDAAFDPLRLRDDDRCAPRAVTRRLHEDRVFAGVQLVWVAVRPFRYEHAVDP